MSTRALLWLTAIGLLGLPLAGEAQTQPPKEAPKDAPRTFPLDQEHRPTPIPDRIVLTWKGDPTRTQAVTWRTNITVKRAEAQLAIAEGGPAFAKKAQTVPAETTPLRTDLGDAHYHSVNFTGLEPSTLYAYRVGDGAHWSEWSHFRTASVKPEPFSFIYFGDAQNDIKSHWSRVVRGAYGDAPKARFLLHAGDLINRANRDAEWGEWFNAGGWVNATMPSIPTPGNHEYETVDGKKMVSRHWRPQFTLPENGPAGLEETTYTLDYQGVRIISLNSNEKQPEQVEWLSQQLEKNPNRWTILTFHHPIFSSAKGRDNKELRRLWKPVLDKYKVDLVLQGHDHTYARSGLIDENIPTGVGARDGKSGTVYVVSVSGPKMYKLENLPWAKKSLADTQLYQIISVDGNKLRYEAKTATGELYDVFELRKRDDGSNELLEREQLEAEGKKVGFAPYSAYAAIAVALGLVMWGFRRLTKPSVVD